MDLGFIGLVFLAIASIWALMGTNAQARIARDRLLEDPDGAIVLAGRLWRPGPRWLARKGTRQRRAAAEARVREEPERFQKYERLRQELWAWNALESAVAMAFAGSLTAVVGVLLDH